MHFRTVLRSLRNKRANWKTSFGCKTWSSWLRVASWAWFCWFCCTSSSRKTSTPCTRRRSISSRRHNNSLQLSPLHHPNKPLATRLLRILISLKNDIAALHFFVPDASVFDCSLGHIPTVLKTQLYFGYECVISKLQPKRLLLVQYYIVSKDILYAYPKAVDDYASSIIFSSPKDTSFHQQCSTHHYKTNFDVFYLLYF